MLENLFHALRPASATVAPSGGAISLPDGVSPQTLEAVRQVAAAAARLMEVRFACVAVADASHREVLICVGSGGGCIVNLPPELCDAVVDPNLVATVMREPRGEKLWKKQRLAGAFAAIEWSGGEKFTACFGALAPLTNGGNPSLGALLLLDDAPHSAWSDAQTAALRELAGLAALFLRSAPPLVVESLPPPAQQEDLETEREACRRAEDSLRDSELLFRSVVQTAGEAIVLSDAAGRIMAWNEGAERIFGFLEENAVGHPLWAMLSRGAEGRRAELESLCADLVRRAGEAKRGSRDAPSAVFEAVARRSVGGEFAVEMTLSAWQGEQNTYVSAFIRDVSTRHASERLRALSHAVSRILAEAPSLDEAAGGILRAIGENQAWGTGALWLIKRAPGVAEPVLRCVQTWTQSHVEVREMDLVRRQSAYACGVGLPGRVWAAGEPLWVEDISRDPHISRSSAIVREKMHTAMGFPIRFGHEILGVIDLYSLEGIASDANFMEMAAGFGSQIGQFIARKQVENEIRSRARQQAAVARLGQRALSRIGSEALLGEAASLVTSTLAVDACSILELLHARQILRTRASAGGRAGMIGEIGIAADATTQAGWTLAAGQPVVVADYHSETRFSVSPALEAAGAVSGVSVVIGGGEEPFGVLLAHVAHERHFSPDDVHFLEAISNVLAASVERDAIEAALYHARDEAERARAEAEAAREDAEAARVEAERANHAKSAFLSHMSHELRTPLNAILGFVQLLDMDDLRPDQEEYVHHIAQGGAHLLRLINEVLEISRIESGRLTLSLQPIAPGAMARDALNFIAPLAAHRSISLDFAESPDWELKVNADIQRLHEILLNLLSNAVKYNREGGRIELSCAAVEGQHLRICVSDTGPGIPPDLLPRLFRAFERLGAENSAVEGTGLGLALTKTLVEAMGGIIEVQSEVGKGSDFCVHLPLCGHSANGTVAAESEPDTSLHDRFDEFEGTVLYVEDNPANLLLVERLLGRYSHIKLVSAMNGEDGLNLARVQQPDVILLDLHLPDMPGAEVLHRLQLEKATRFIPVIIVTADATSAQHEKLLEDGAHDYLVKPLDIRALLNVLQATLPPVK